MLKKMKITIGALLAVLFISAIGAVSFFYLRSEQVNQVQEFQNDLHRGLVENCKKNGNPLREAVQNLLKEQIKNSSDPRLLEEFFPQIPAHRLRLLIAKQITIDEELISQIAPLDCSRIYDK